MPVAEPLRVPGVDVSAVAAPARLGVVERHVVAFVVGAGEAFVAEHARLVDLARPANPHDVVPAECVLAHPAPVVGGGGLPELVDGAAGVGHGGVPRLRPGVGGDQGRGREVSRRHCRPPPPHVVVVVAVLLLLTP